jgi:tRNA(Ile)-lysidine synthase
MRGVTDLIGHVENNIAHRNLLRDGQRVLLATSGGVDSMVLLELLHRLSTTHKWKLTVAHFNHRLRGKASDADERMVGGVTREYGLSFIAGHGDVAAFARKSGLSTEMAARKLRHEFLAATALTVKAPAIAMAHHADDQVELFFLRLFRGAGGDGLAGMKWRNPSPVTNKILLARPLLDVSKAALQNFALENNVPFSEDATNASVDFQRNRVRRELLPLLKEDFQPALERTILRVMDVIGSEAEFAAGAAKGWLKSKRRISFDALAVAVQRRLIQQQLVVAKLLPEFELIERLRLSPGQSFAVNANLTVLRDPKGLVQTQKPEPLAFERVSREFQLSRKEQELGFGGLRICCKIADDNGMAIAQKSKSVEYFDADKVGGHICLRRWEPGDRFQPIGTQSPRKLQDLFTNLKVPRAERRRRVVATTAHGELFWVEGLRMAEKFKLDNDTTRKLQWAWKRLEP